ncbi:hypothetical protein ABEW03_01285, partial [Virgibacillus pantothenticus]|uniref:hypothetical protein n=1 Tax=Virgibacillus pantothenticus TaxID=1473 RepID=UPI003D2D2C00
ANYDLATEVEKLMKENQSNELIVITDIFGGSVNFILSYSARKNTKKSVRYLTGVMKKINKCYQA